MYLGGFQKQHIKAGSPGYLKKWVEKAEIIQFIVQSVHQPSNVTSI